jgi:hypothetical protein
VKPLGALATSALLLALAACQDPGEREPSWSYIHTAIIGPNCATSNCHSSLGSSVLGTGAAGLQLDQRESSFYLLTGRPCDESGTDGQPPSNLVVPGQPESSKLVYLLRGVEVDRMPPDIPLPEGEIELIEDWILEGAPCN